MAQRSSARIIIIPAIMTLVVGGGGLILTLILNAFVLDKFNAYGEVPIPGSSSLYLPAGEVTASFHTVVTGGTGSGLPVPNLNLSIVAPEGLPEVEVHEDFGGSTTVNNDARVRVWTVYVAQEGTYRITTDGDVGGYISPRLAFGHGSEYGWLTWVFAALLALGVVELAVGLTLSARNAKKARLLEPHEMALDQPTWASPPPPVTPSETYTPSDQGIRLEQIRQLAALRDSGALTEDEYRAEKRRILDT
jgi:hypothetical protein